MSEWYADVKELVDTYHPDLLYSDSQLAFGDTGRSMLANFYNGNLAFHNGISTAVYNCKQPSGGKWVEDLERGVQDSISPFPWQTDTSIGDWFYRTGQRYKTSTEILQMLVDIVSKNGNLLINMVQTPEGDLEPDVLKTLDEIGLWMKANGEGIYGTRPWKVFGEHPVNTISEKGGSFNEEKLKYTAGDIRFTAKGKQLYAFCLNMPDKEIIIRSLGKSSKFSAAKITHIKMLGSNSPLVWRQDGDALVIQKPVVVPNWNVLGFDISFE